MANVRKIKRAPRTGRNYYLVDTNFIVNKFLPASTAPTVHERDRIAQCQTWWQEIDSQTRKRKARVYIPDVCIAEAFKALAQKHYTDNWFRSSAQFGAAKAQLSSYVRINTKTLRSFSRNIEVHDISTNRDIVISVERFFKVFATHKKIVQIADLILVATAKYLLDFYDIPKDRLHIVTLDNRLREGIAKLTEIPNAYDPTRSGHRADVVFET
jgi:predicted nucleic acid-binding protein